MDKILVKVELIESDVYNSRPLVKVEMAVPVDSKADFKGEITHNYSHLANCAALGIIRELESDVRLNKELRGVPCCDPFKVSMEQGEFDRGAEYCKFCGKAIGKELYDKAVKLAHC